ncbi:MAG: ABC transporter permease [Chloroflexi bacterium 13_1_40CM_3_70_6]|nr:MAG: ABC transporter permease [Chloroflexi bacterium 13_1_40CM_3_70_6]
MRLIGDVARWFADPANWQGSHGIPVRVAEHLELSGLAVAVGILAAVPLALYLGHVGRGGFIAINIANIGRALPSLALLAFALPLAFSLGLGLGFWPTLLALVPLAIPPILTNTFVAVRGVDRDVVEAARGMGLSEAQILRSIEVPLGLPLMLAGIRTAAVNVVATATLGALVAGGALGRFIVDGLALQEYDQLFAGALLVALLAIATEFSFAALERATLPPGMATAS